MSGKIRGISGPTVSVDLKGLKLYERVYVGHAMLTGEVVRLDRDRAVVQVYEDTRGLAAGEPVKGVGMPLTVRLGPGLLGGMFDGLQRPLERIREEMGPFITGGKEMYALDYQKRWQFAPLLKKGDPVQPGSIIGTVNEKAFKHSIMSSPDMSGTIKRIIGNDFSLDEPLGEYDDGREIAGCHEWPVRIARPYRRKFAPAEPLVTGQRSIDFLFPLARGGTAIFPGGFGTGKTILEQSIAKFADVDIVVYVGCGERGNEMADMIADFKELQDPWTKRPLRERTILVVNTSNMPVAAREASIYTAVTMAEYYRDMGYHVLFLADSLSRWAEALREISASLEEMPGEEGYPTYLASRLSGFLERAGVVETLNGKIGSLSYDPVRFTSGRRLYRARDAGLSQDDRRVPHARYVSCAPAALIRRSTGSRAIHSMPGMSQDHYQQKVSPEWGDLLRWCRRILQEEESLREVAEIVGAEGLQDADRLLMRTAEMIRTEFLQQNAYSEDAFSCPRRPLAMMKADS